MTNEFLALGAIALVAASGMFAALAGFRSRSGDRMFVAIMVLGSTVGLIAAVRAMIGHGLGPLTVPWRVPGGVFAVEVDALSAMFLAQIFLVAALGAIYGSSYWSARDKPKTAGKLRVFYGLLVAGMALLVIARNSVVFLAGWEVMALCAFLTITTEDNVQAVRDTGYLYLVTTRVGTLFVFATFVVLRSMTGSFTLSSEALDGGSTPATAVFLLGLVGFGLKAGMVPMHIWLPSAHANAPSHVSALMSGVLIKMGIYGLIRTYSLFERVPPWWGLVLLAFGMISAVLGVAFALAQHDLKRLLAYHSVENIGIIVMGLGIAMLGRATGHPALVVLGLSGALLHVWNHGLFKALLFFSAGSVIHATNARNIESFGGLGRRMPQTTLAFLVGAIAICGLPPLNGFVSELLVYLGMLRAGLFDLGTSGLFAALGVPVLALVGGLAAVCFIKVFGVVFLGEPRGASIPGTHESPASMLGPMGLLAVLCVAIGVAPVLVMPVLDRVTSTWLGGPTRPSLAEFAPITHVAWANGAIALFLVFVYLSLARRPHGGSDRVPTWDCGYSSPSSRMQYTASSFADRLVGLFSFALRRRVEAPKLATTFPIRAHFHTQVPDVILDLWILPAGRWSARAAASLRWIQQGQVHLYLLYVVGALIAMLVLWR
jgi:hydrogenase-4 component B